MKFWVEYMRKPSKLGRGVLNPWNVKTLGLGSNKILGCGFLNL